MMYPLEVAAGEALGVVGESGCGKSTLTRAVLRLGPVTSGEIVWLGRAIQDLPNRDLRAMRAGMQIVFQDPFASLDPTMSVAEVVAEPLRALRPDMTAAERSAKVSAMLASVGLGAEFAQRRSRELSGGQCQRVAIARAMVLEPRLLVCDEAVSALDVSIQAQLLDSVRIDQAGSWHQHRVREPQSRRGAQAVRTRAGHVPRPRGGRGAHRGSFPPAAASLHPHVVRVGAAARPGARAGAAGDALGAGRNPVGGRSTERMRLSHALPGGAIHMRRDSSRDGSRRGFAPGGLPALARTL